MSAAVSGRGGDLFTWFLGISCVRGDQHQAAKPQRLQITPGEGGGFPAASRLEEPGFSEEGAALGAKGKAALMKISPGIWIPFGSSGENIQVRPCMPGCLSVHLFSHDWRMMEPSRPEGS